MPSTFFHTHDDGFTGTHTHVVNGSNVEHTHTGTPELPVVEVFGARYKQPTAPLNDDATATTLTVDDVAHDTPADSAG